VEISVISLGFFFAGEEPLEEEFGEKFESILWSSSWVAVRL